MYGPCSHGVYSLLEKANIHSGGLEPFSKGAVLKLLIIFYLCWGIVDLQCCVSFRCREKWFRYTCT